MAVLHRALCTWFVCLIFLILLVLRLDERTRWSWFIVFIPMWLYDGVLIVYLAFEMVTYCRAPGGPGGRYSPSLSTWIWFKISFPLNHHNFISSVIPLHHCRAAARYVRRKAWYLACAAMKLAIQIMICLKLENLGNGALDIPLYYIMIPLWIMLPVTIADLFFNNLTSVKVTRWLRNART